MRWSIIRLIWLRELRDQLRDRRTLFMIAVLPMLLYPVLGFAVLRFAMGVIDRPSVIGIERTESGNSGDFPQQAPQNAEQVVPRCLAWFALTPALSFPERIVSVEALAKAVKEDGPPPLLRIKDGKAVLVAGYQLDALVEKIRFEFLDPQAAQEALESKRIDLFISASPDFYARVKRSESPNGGDPAIIKFQGRAGEDRYHIAKARVDILLGIWKKHITAERLKEHELPPNFDEPFSTDEKSEAGGQPQRILGLMVRIFPFMLVMWSLAGALYPAVDLCAGEKERGTMETLLISPVGRDEIVIGKFLTIWMFSAGTALLNLVSMGLTTWQTSQHLPLGTLPLDSLLWCMVLLLPLSAFFSAISLAVGAYARSSKEGQYYLMPLFLITMPLMFLTLAPGVELNPFYSLVPVTGAALLMQKLMTATTLAQVPWFYFVPVLAPIVLYSYLALRWAIAQFHREEVLFREAERLDLKLWFLRLFREKEETPSTGQAFFIFSMVLGLNWLSLSIGQQLPIVAHTSIRLLAFVAAPPLLFALILSTKPLLALRLKWPTWREVGLAAILAVLLLPSVAYLSVYVLTTYPDMAQLLLQRQPLVEELQSVIVGRQLDNDAVPYLIGLALLPALSEELCFRGFLLSGLLRNFRPLTAVVLVSFLFALYHMNVFLFLPAFIVGVVLGLLTQRSRSVLPAFVFHLLFKTVLIVGVHVYGQWHEEIPNLVKDLWLPGTAIFLVIALVLLWRLYRAPYWAEMEHWSSQRLTS